MWCLELEALCQGTGALLFASHLGLRAKHRMLSLDHSSERGQSISSDPECGLLCSFQQLSMAGNNTLGRSIRLMNRAGACVSPHNITAESLQSLNISSILPQQWQNFTTASSSESFVPTAYTSALLTTLTRNSDCHCVASLDIGHL